MSGRVLVLNPNSDRMLTKALGAQLQAVFPGALLDVGQLDAAPKGIATYRDIHAVEALLAERFTTGVDSHAAIVIACFADPGVSLLRELLDVPVLGMAASGTFHALSLGRPLGVVSAGRSVLPRHWEFYRSLGVDHLVAGDEATDLPPGVTHPRELMEERLLTVGRGLISAGVRSLLLGCAAFSEFRSWLEAQLEVPVVDPLLAATSQALLLAAQGER